MLNILGISMKSGSYFRVMVEATEDMKQKWLDIINEDCDDCLTFEDAIKNSCYRSNNDGYLVMEVELDLEDNSCHTVYFFDDYEDIDVEISNDDYNQCVDFINKWKDKLPDNCDYSLGDSEWYDLIPDDIPWKK